jgi:8-oxo-dGTP pyrophosphatase MutT (NUDIX family)
MSRPVEPVEAATVILARHGVPTGSPWQCFMVRRHIKSEFASDVFVFPGGKVDEADRSADSARFSIGHPGPEWGGDEDHWRAIRLAALRELFEEAGVLLAQGRDGRTLHLAGPVNGRYQQYRRALHTGEISLVEIAEREDLIFALDALHLVSRWITPESFRRRFDTYFFVAYLPAGQQPDHDQRETTESVWITPREALERAAAGEFPLVFATEKHLERMAQFASVEEFIASAATADLRPVMPRMVRNGEDVRFLIPGDEGY